MAIFWCPSCQHSLETLRETCPDCLADLQAAASDTIPCPTCGHDCRSTMETCPNCFASLQTDGTDLVMNNMRTGALFPRPRNVGAFRSGPNCTLTRGANGRGLMILGQDKFIEAYVERADQSNAAVCPLICRDVDGSLLFRLEKYTALADSLVAHGADGAAIASFVRRTDGLTTTIDVRDETSAPIGRLRPAIEGEWSYELVETGGPVIAGWTTYDMNLDAVVDDVWNVKQLSTRIPLKPLGLIALTVAAKIFLGRATPAARPPERSDEDSVETLGLLGQWLAGDVSD